MNARHVDFFTWKSNGFGGYHYSILAEQSKVVFSHINNFHMFVLFLFSGAHDIKTGRSRAATKGHNE